MEIKLVVCFILSFFSSSFAIKCYFCDAQAKSCEKSCEGDFCFIWNSTYQTPEDEIKLEKGCYKGSLPRSENLGCYKISEPESKDDTECVCNTEFCNSDFLLQKTATEPKLIECNHSLGGEQMNSCKGIHCTFTKTTKISKNSAEISFQTQECQFTMWNPGLNLIPIQSDPYCVQQTMLLEDSVYFGLICQCETENCNNEENFIPPKINGKSVTCALKLCKGGSDNCKDYGTCVGAYCFERKTQ